MYVSTMHLSRYRLGECTTKGYIKATYMYTNLTIDFYLTINSGY